MTENIPACQGDKPSPSLSLALFSSSGLLVGQMNYLQDSLHGIPILIFDSEAPDSPHVIQWHKKGLLDINTYFGTRI